MEKKFEKIFSSNFLISFQQQTLLLHTIVDITALLDRASIPDQENIYFSIPKTII